MWFCLKTFPTYTSNNKLRITFDSRDSVMHKGKKKMFPWERRYCLWKSGDRDPLILSLGIVGRQADKFTASSLYFRAYGHRYMLNSM